MGKEIMFRSAIFAACVAAASAFAPLSSPLPNAVSGRVTATSGPSMQLFGEGKVQGKGVVAIPPLGRPDTPIFDGTWSGDVGFDPLTISGWFSNDWLREAELKHCRVAMLATLGCIVQDVMKFPGVEKVYSGDIKLTKLHDAAVEQGTMGQMLFWLTDSRSSVPLLSSRCSRALAASPATSASIPLALARARTSRASSLPSSRTDVWPCSRSRASSTTTSSPARAPLSS